MNRVPAEESLAAARPKPSGVSSPLTARAQGAASVFAAPPAPRAPGAPELYLLSGSSWTTGRDVGRVLWYRAATILALHQFGTLAIAVPSSRAFECAGKFI